MLAPRATRVIGWVFVINAISNMLNLVYETAFDMSKKTSGVMEQKMEKSSADE